MKIPGGEDVASKGIVAWKFCVENRRITRVECVSVRVDRKLPDAERARVQRRERLQTENLKKRLETLRTIKLRYGVNCALKLLNQKNQSEKKNVELCGSVQRARGC